MFEPAGSGPVPLRVGAFTPFPKSKPNHFSRVSVPVVRIHRDYQSRVIVNPRALSRGASYLAVTEFARRHFSSSRVVRSRILSLHYHRIATRHAIATHTANVIASRDYQVAPTTPVIFGSRAYRSGGLRSEYSCVQNVSRLASAVPFKSAARLSDR